MHGKGAGKGSLLAALAEAAFLIGAEKNRYLSFLRICIKQHISTLYVKVKIIRIKLQSVENLWCEQCDLFV